MGNLQQNVKPNSWLISNSTLDFADRVLRDKPLVNAYSIFDLSKLIECILLAETVTTLPSGRHINKIETFKKLKEEKILEHSCVNGLESIIAQVRSGGNLNFEERINKQNIAKIFTSIFPAEYDRVLRILSNITSWSTDVWQSPNFGAYNWFISNEEYYHVKNEILWRMGWRDDDDIQEIISETYLRSILYLLVASECGFNYAPDSVRIPIINYIHDELNRDLQNFGQKVIAEIENRKGILLKSNNQDFNFIKKQNIQMPSLFGMVLGNCKSKDDFLNKAFEFREKSELVNLRRLLSEYDRSIRSDDDVQANKIINQVQKTIKEIESSMSLEGNVETFKIDIVDKFEKLKPMIGILAPLLGYQVLQDQDIVELATIISSMAVTLSFQRSFTTRLIHYFKNRRLIFLYNMGKHVDQAQLHNKDLNRVFGDELSSHDIDHFHKLKAYEKSYLSYKGNSY